MDCGIVIKMKLIADFHIHSKYSRHLNYKLKMTKNKDIFFLKRDLSTAYLTRIISLATLLIVNPTALLVSARMAVLFIRKYE